MEKINHNAWLADDRPHPKRRMPIAAWLAIAATIQFAADIAQLIGFSF